MRTRPITRIDADDLRPCSHVKLCRRDEAKACDNCYDWFWRPHGALAVPQDEDAEEKKAIEARAAAEQGKTWKSSSLF